MIPDNVVVQLYPTGVNKLNANIVPCLIQYSKNTFLKS